MLAICSVSTSNNFTSDALELWKVNTVRRLIIKMTIVFTFTDGCNSQQDFKNIPSVYRWNSSGKTYVFFKSTLITQLLKIKI